MPDATLLEQLDAAETRLIQAEYRLHEARSGRAGGRDFAGALRSADLAEPLARLGVGARVA